MMRNYIVGNPIPPEYSKLFKEMEAGKTSGTGGTPRTLTAMDLIGITAGRMPLPKLPTPIQPKPVMPPNWNPPVKTDPTNPKYTAPDIMKQPTQTLELGPRTPESGWVDGKPPKSISLSPGPITQSTNNIQIPNNINLYNQQSTPTTNSIVPVAAKSPVINSPTTQIPDLAQRSLKAKLGKNRFAEANARSKTGMGQLPNSLL
jgi:hypothetical protein